MVQQFAVYKQTYHMAAFEELIGFFSGPFIDVLLIPAIQQTNAPN